MKTIFLLSISIMAASSVATAQDFTPPKVVSQTPGGVNLSDGSFMMSDEDLSIGPLKFERFHLGGRRDSNIPPFGPRTTHSFSIYVAPNQSTRCSQPGYSQSCITSRRPIVHIGKNATGQYSDISSNQYNYSLVKPNDGDSYRGTLSRIGANPYTYVDDQGAFYTFSNIMPAGGAANAQRIESILFADGRKQVFLYDSTSRLKLVTDNSGYAIAFEYNASNLLTTVCGYNTSISYVNVNTGCAGSTIKATYAYANGHLTEAVNASGEKKVYTWSGDRVTCVSYVGQPCRISNEFNTTQGSWMVTKQTMVDGSEWSFDYQGRYDGVRNPETYADAIATTSVTVTDPEKKVSQYSFMESSPVSIIDGNKNETKYSFSGGRSFDSPVDNADNFGSTLTKVIFPRNNSISVEYAGPRRSVSKQVLTSTSGDQLQETFGYDTGCDIALKPQICPKPIWMRDANGEQTDFTYTSFGAIESQMKPAPSAGAARPLTLYTYTQRAAYIKTSSGSLVADSSPIWLKATETVCQTAVASNKPNCDYNAPIIVKSYEYGVSGIENSLWVRGISITADSRTRRTCYAYDYSGNQISESRPRANESMCF